MTGVARRGEGSPPAREFSVGAGRGRCRLWGTAVVTAGGVALTLVGGERPHVGAVAIGIPRPSLSRSAQPRATTSVLTVTGHKDDELARPLADALARRSGLTAVVVAGVHVRQPRGRDFERIFRNAERVLEAVLAEVDPPARGTRRRA